MAVHSGVAISHFGPGILRLGETLGGKVPTSTDYRDFGPKMVTCLQGRISDILCTLGISLIQGEGLQGIALIHGEGFQGSLIGEERNDW